MSILVLSKPDCVQCTATYRKLDSDGLEYDTDDIYEHMDTLAKLNVRSAPVVLVKDEDGTIADYWAGFRPDKIEALTAEVKAA